MNVAIILHALDLQQLKEQACSEKDPDVGFCAEDWLADRSFWFLLPCRSSRG